MTIVSGKQRFQGMHPPTNCRRKQNDRKLNEPVNQFTSRMTGPITSYGTN
jgi:hypothetical protein